MITLCLGIYEGDIEQIPFDSVNSLIDYIEELKMFNCIWLVTEDGENGEIMITENIDKIITAIGTDHWNLCSQKDSMFHLQEYQTYEDAYAVALDMREENPKCYN